MPALHQTHTRSSNNNASNYNKPPKTTTILVGTGIPAIQIESGQTKNNHSIDELKKELQKDLIHFVGTISSKEEYINQADEYRYWILTSLAEFGPNIDFNTDLEQAADDSDELILIHSPSTIGVLIEKDTPRNKTFNKLYNKLEKHIRVWKSLTQNFNIMVTPETINQILPQFPQ